MPNLGTFHNQKMCPPCHLTSGAHLGHYADMAGNGIARLRKIKGLSQDELAEAIGTTRNALGKLERGDRRLNMDWIEKIAAKMGVEPYEILITEGSPVLAPQEWPPSGPVLTSTFALLLDSVGIDPDEDERAQKLARQFPSALKHVADLRGGLGSAAGKPPVKAPPDPDAGQPAT